MKLFYVKLQRFHTLRNLSFLNKEEFATYFLQTNSRKKKKC